MAAMGIPPFNLSGVLPPYLGASPAGLSTGMSPYKTTVDELVTHFNSSPERRAILTGFLQFRARLRTLGIQGWQWLDGSFLENIEANESRAPHDIDVVTFSFRPPLVQAQPAWVAFCQQNMDVFSPDQAKVNFHCDARFVELNSGPYEVVSQSRYWFGLFSHQRVSLLWKGMLEVVLPANDIDVNARAAVGI